MTTNEDRWKPGQSWKDVAPAISTRDCARCDGTGEVRRAGHEDRHSNDPDLSYVECPECFGSGRV